MKNALTSYVYLDLIFMVNLNVINILQPDFNYFAKTSHNIKVHNKIQSQKYMWNESIQPRALARPVFGLMVNQEAR